MEKKITTIPVLALGKSATRVAQNLNAQLGEQLDLYTMTEPLDDVPQILFPHEHPYRFLIYNRAEVATDVVKKFGTAAKIGGRVLGLEIAACHEVVRSSWQMGTDVLIRSDSEDVCQKVAAPLLRMALPQKDFLGIDIADVFSLFHGTDCARVSMAASTGERASVTAIAEAMRHLGWPPSSLRGILLRITGSEDHITMTETEKLMDVITDKIAEDGNMMWGASIDPALGDTVQVTVIATRGWRQESKDACDWLSQLVEVTFHDNDE